MKKLLIATFLLCASLQVNAQEKYMKNVAETEAVSKNVMQLFTKGDISESFDLITPYWPLPYNEIEALEEKTLKYVNIIEQRFGKSIGFLRVKRETIKDIAIRETYIIRHKFHAMRVIFTYYKSDEGWLINSFKWDDSFTDEFKED
ncbi:hypothetical protein U8527_12785 [Kordia algicida OT-1]|uniref:DUF4440 domain-containing protein n=1 Tax=Kordia algicida OT-1 TaxID=391587 RepID=A9ED58_9FLAO|nr:hypothetical protein [Kordia algicida]EDP94281.1 hypothetical protein KAOT1_06357 [Kordia algicida OT-1]